MIAVTNRRVLPPMSIKVGDFQSLMEQATSSLAWCKDKDKCGMKSPGSASIMEKSMPHLTDVKVCGSEEEEIQI